MLVYLFDFKILQKYRPDLYAIFCKTMSIFPRWFIVPKSLVLINPDPKITFFVTVVLPLYNLYNYNLCYNLKCTTPNQNGGHEKI